MDAKTKLRGFPISSQRRRRAKKMQRWIKQYNDFDPDKHTKQEIFRPLREYETILRNVRCVYMRMSKSTTKVELVKRFKSAKRGAKRIVALNK